MQMSEEVRELRSRMKDFIDDVVMKAEPELDRLAESDLHPDTGIPLELYEAAAERGDDTGSRCSRPRSRRRVELPTQHGRHGRPEGRGEGPWAVGARASEGDRRRRSAVHGLRVPERDHRPVGVRPGRRRHGDHAGLDHAPPLRQRPQQRAATCSRWSTALIYPSVGLTEPAVAGSDPTQMQTTAELDGDEWVINGRKWFTSGATRAAYTTVFAKTDPDNEKHFQFSAIIVPTDTAGLPHPAGGADDGSRSAASTARSCTTTCACRATNLLGERGRGFLISQKRLGPGRIFHCMRWLGQAQRAFELMCERALTRYAHGSLLAEKGAIQQMIAESAAEIQGARLMTLDAARAMDAGTEARVEISLIKFHGAKMLHNVIDRAIQVHGALGVTGDRPLDKMYREARYARLYDGPDEVHHMVVARNLLKNYKNGAPWS